MAEKSIFIASAAESRAIAEAISLELEAHGYRPLRWWTEFPPGSVTVDHLLKIARTADGAVFLCSGVDKVWYRLSETASPRDNVILEYGMFLSTLGLQRALLLKDEGTRLPSDIHAVTY